MIRVSYRGRTSNLHAVWDTALVDGLGESEGDILGNVSAGVPAVRLAGWKLGSLRDWLLESRDVARSSAYTPAVMAAFAGGEMITLDPSYISQAEKTALEQLAKAGARMTERLNRLLTSTPQGPNIATLLGEGGEKKAPAPATSEEGRKLAQEPARTDSAVKNPPAPQPRTLSRWLWSAGAALALAFSALAFALQRRSGRSVFVCYRRDDSSAQAGRICDRLQKRFGKGRVFRDLDSIAPGENFRQAIARMLATCDAVLVLIGPDWLTCAGEDGARRIFQPDDVVRNEVAAALESGALVVPVLVDGARMPERHELPASLGDLADRNAVVIYEQHFEGSVARVISAVARAPRRRRPL
jgi:hypothetical protein